MRINQIFSHRRMALLSYLATKAKNKETKVGTLNELSETLHLSTASLREQLEVARILGMVDIKPGKGISLNSFSLRPAIRYSVGYAIAIDPAEFFTFSDLRNHIEAAYWHQAVTLLTDQDFQKLEQIIQIANDKLEDVPIKIPHLEHRELHLILFSRLGNPFVNGILEAFWELYEVVGFDLYSDYVYLKEVWQYHEKIVDAIGRDDYDAGYRYLLEHTDFLNKRTKTNYNQLFE